MSNVNGESGVTPTESETTGMAENSPRGSREAPETSVSSMAADRSEKTRGHHPDMHVAGESDSFIVPQKQANKDSGPLSAESVEGRGLTEENVLQLRPDRTLRRASRSRGLLGVREAALISVGFWSSSSEVSAVCGSSARTDLCGGRSATAVPTAIGEEEGASCPQPSTPQRSPLNAPRCPAVPRRWPAGCSPLCGS